MVREVPLECQGDSGGGRPALFYGQTAVRAQKGAETTPCVGWTLFGRSLDQGTRVGWHKASVSGCLPLAAPIGLHILTLCGSERVLVVSTEPLDGRGGGAFTHTGLRTFYERKQNVEPMCSPTPNSHANSSQSRDVQRRGGGGGACAWGAATIKGMAWPASPVATGCQGNPCSTSIRWGVSPASQMGCLRNRSGSPSGADQP